MSTESQQIERVSTPKHNVVAWLETKMDRISEYCTGGITGEQLCRTFNTALVRDPSIAECTKESIILAVTQCARYGLDPTGDRNTAHFIAFKNNKKGVYELQLMIGYGGLIDLIIRNTEVIDIQTEVVYRGEEFEVLAGTEQRIKHVYDIATRNLRTYEEVVAAYAVATFPNGHKKFVVLSRKELDQIKATSKSKDSVWNYSPIEMAKKSPVRNMSKWLSIGPEFYEVLQISDHTDGADFSRREASQTQSMEAPDSIANRIRSIPGSVEEPYQIDTVEDQPENPLADDSFAEDIAGRMDNQKQTNS